MRPHYRSMLLCTAICLAAAALSYGREETSAAKARADAAVPAVRGGPAATDLSVLAPAQTIYLLRLVALSAIVLAYGKQTILAQAY